MQVRIHALLYSGHNKYGGHNKNSGRPFHRNFKVFKITFKEISFL